MSWILELIKNKYRVCVMNGFEDDIQVRIEDLESKNIMLFNFKEDEFLYQSHLLMIGYIRREWQDEFGETMRS